MSLEKYSTWQLHLAMQLGVNHMPEEPAARAEIQGFICQIQSEMAKRVLAGTMGQGASDRPDA